MILNAPIHPATDIGNGKEDAKFKQSDRFANEPKRNELLKVVIKKPLNAETPLELDVSRPITPNDLHFVKNHNPVPNIDVESYKLELENEITHEKFSFTMADLKNNFQVHTIPMTIQCSGNKRGWMNKEAPVKGTLWGPNAISNAEWTGVLLRDVLEYCHVDYNDDRVRHIQFEGSDKDVLGSFFGGSIPKEKAFNPYGDVLLAFGMNGVDLPRDHGYPLRVVIPGVIGARSIKWLSKIVVSSTESKCRYHAIDYKVYPPWIKGRDIPYVDHTKYRAVQESPVQSAISQPLDGVLINRRDGTFTVKGYAYSGGGRSIDRVLVSTDGGKDSWRAAEISQDNAPLYRCWTWALWECEIEIPKDKDKMELVCVATDSDQNTQPEKAIWNVQGVVNNSWHRITVNFE